MVLEDLGAVRGEILVTPCRRISDRAGLGPGAGGLPGRATAGSTVRAALPLHSQGCRLTSAPPVPWSVSSGRAFLCSSNVFERTQLPRAGATESLKYTLNADVLCSAGNRHGVIARRYTLTMETGPAESFGYTYPAANARPPAPAGGGGGAPGGDPSGNLDDVAGQVEQHHQARKQGGGGPRLPSFRQGAKAGGGEAAEGAAGAAEGALEDVAVAALL